MRCMECGRTLKGIQSIERGYGPVCFQKKYPAKIRVRSQKVPDNTAVIGEDYSVPGQMELSEFIEMTVYGNNE